MLKLRTNARTLDVVQNEDGTLSISWRGQPINNAGQFINQLGGIDAVIARCKEYTEEEWQTELERVKALREADKEAALCRSLRFVREHEEAYKAVFESGTTVETTPHSIYVLLTYLNDHNWGEWTLPKMSIGYSCNQYDCDGKQATTIKLDEPIDYDGELVDKFQIGAPVGHLTKYHRIWE